jgi:hypothetical protein
MGTPTTLKGWLERIAQILAVAAAAVAAIRQVTSGESH